MKKILALVLALLVAMSMTAAFADVEPTLGSYEGSQNRNFGVVDGSKVPLTKSIIIFNPENGTDVREPNIQFAYTVTPVTAADELGTITDDGRYNENVPVTVKANAGVAGVVTGTTIKFGETKTAPAKTTGTEVEYSGNLTVDLTNIPHAGVYRYLITETAQDLSGNSINVTAYGLEERGTEYDTTRYLDLYVANKADGTGFELTGAVIFKTNTKDDSNTSATSGITTTTDKTTGYEPGTETPASDDPDYTNDKEVDRYFTYNLKVGKTTTGALADKTHDFPFEIKVTGALTPVVKTDLTVNNATNITAGVQNVNTTVLTLSPKMSDGDYIELKGIPKGTTVTVKETNDTPDTYTASWDETKGTTTTATVESDNATTTDMNLPSGKSASASAVAIDGNQTDEYVKTELGFTNNMAEISNTGIVLRFAPYALMLAAGIVLLVLSRKRRTTKDED